MRPLTTFEAGCKAFFGERKQSHHLVVLYLPVGSLHVEQSISG